MHANEPLLRKFYEAFAARDGEAMAACYHPQVHFTDPVFDLHGAEAGKMWRMLCSAGGDLKIEFSDLKAGDAAGTAHWEAWYTFTQTGRRVHNIVDARFAFQDGLILRHEDRFDFHRWASQALGPLGWALGGTAFLQRKVRKMALRRLRAFAVKSEECACCR